MELIISDNDFIKLSKRTQEELITFFLKSKTTDEYVEKKIEEKGYNEGSLEGEYEEPFNMTTKMAKQFLSGCSKTTKQFLKIFAANDGYGYVDRLLEAINLPNYTTKRDLNGVLAGISKRLRKLYSDPKSRLVIWEWNEDVPEYEGYFYISKTTCQSLKEYFEI